MVSDTIHDLFDLGECIAKLEERSRQLYERLGREIFMKQESLAELTRIELHVVQNELKKEKKRLEGWQFKPTDEKKEEKS